MLLNLTLILLVYMTSWFILSIIFKRNDVADIAWGLGFVVLSWSAFTLTKEKSLIALITNIMITVWGLRLFFHILKRNIKKAEDYRYKKWRENWRFFYLRSFFQVFMLQGFLLFIIVFPVLLINFHQPKCLTLVAIGALIWLAGFIFEVISDMQLANFLKDPKNKGEILQTGLWKYSRHPNYFGEITLWWGIFLIAASSNYGIFSILRPITITFLITKVSGIPMLEEKLMQNPDFVEYAKKTSILIPKTNHIIDF